MLLNEAYGAVTEKGLEWNSLCNAIIEYMFDVKDGLNADPFYNYNKTPYFIVNRSNITSYYKYRHGSLTASFIPNWIDDFTLILIDDEKYYNGFFNKAKALIKNGKLNFQIYMYNHLDQDTSFEVLTHEFMHAYEFYNKTIKGRPATKKTGIYQKYLEDSKNGVYKPIKLVGAWGSDFLEINAGIYNDIELFENAVRHTFYLLDNSEIKSFIQQYTSDIARKINRKNNECYQYLLNVYTEKKNIDITDFPVIFRDNFRYREYEATYKIWKNIDRVDFDVADQAVEDLKSYINMYNHKPSDTELLNIN